MDLSWSWEQQQLRDSVERWVKDAYPLEARRRVLLGDRLRDPQVIVTIVQYAPRRVFVGGEVNQPGPVLIQEGMTPVQAIFERGGFKDTAERDGVVLIRDAGSENPQIGRIDVFMSLENGKPEAITLLTNDVIYVPMSGIGRVSTWIRQHLREIIPMELIGAAGMAAGT